MEASNQPYNKVRVSIMGRQYTLKGDLDADYMAMLAGRLDEQIDQMKDSLPGMDTLPLVILVALNLADELERLKKSGGSRNKLDEISEKTSSLIGMLEKGIVGD